MSFTNFKHLSAETWKKIKAVSRKPYQTGTPILQVSDTVYTDSAEVAEIFARHYARVSSSLSYTQDFQILKNRSESNKLDFYSNNAEPYNQPFTIAELREALSSTRNSSPGIDRIPYSFLKNLPLYSEQELLDIYNNIWATGTFPDSWRQAIIMPLHKEGKNSSEPQGYCPVSLTCCLSKVLEKMISYRLVWLLESRNLLSKY